MRLSPPRVAVVVALLLSAYIFQSAFLARLGLPGAVPDIVLVVVIGLAIAAGPTAGTVIGFATGVLIGLAPPGTGALGLTAATYAIVGFAAGHLSMPMRKPPMSLTAVAGGLCGASVLGLAILSSLMGSEHGSWSLAAWLAVTSAAYGMALAYLALPLVGSLFRGAPGHGQTAR